MRRSGKVAFMVLLLLLPLAFWGAERARAQNPTLYWGSTGWHVMRVQQRLAQWGYYDGPIDGVFGYKTWKAVRYFQWKNGLAVDGVVGPATWAALGFPSYTPTPTVSRGYTTDRDAVLLLARLIMGEAADEPFEGKVAVGAVVLNRMRHPSFPKTIPGVIFQPGAFESVSNGQIWRPLSPEAVRAAGLALAGWDPTGGALYFWNPAKTVSPWVWTRTIITRIGNHVFAR
ncbi:spore cortex-lytic enzyme [Ammonifex degensii KC4]|uniref:Spore cortex-lytic enzyme n=2 Tax=Ammonifex degensii TaxID=42838 RepID=C9RAB0_AMMDK|nr:spore cortex-lytic enzyme [Ammonifex degensii KC4]